MPSDHPLTASRRPELRRRRRRRSTDRSRDEQAESTTRASLEESASNYPPEQPFAFSSFVRRAAIGATMEKACRSRVRCEQCGSRHVEVWRPLPPAMRDRGEAMASACGERPRANNAAVQWRAREHPELRVEAGTRTGRPATGVWPAASDTDRLCNAEAVAVPGRKVRSIRSSAADQAPPRSHRRQSRTGELPADRGAGARGGRAELATPSVPLQASLRAALDALPGHRAWPRSAPRLVPHGCPHRRALVPLASRRST